MLHKDFEIWRRNLIELHASADFDRFEKNVYRKLLKNGTNAFRRYI